MGRLERAEIWLSDCSIRARELGQQRTADSSDGGHNLADICCPAGTASGVRLSASWQKFSQSGRQGRTPLSDTCPFFNDATVPKDGRTGLTVKECDGLLIFICVL